MIAQATTIIDVWRDVTVGPGSLTTNEYGDETETPRDTGDPTKADDPYLSGIPASIIEESRRIVDPTSGDMRLLKYVVGKVTGGTDVAAGDIVGDRKDGTRYRVRSISQKQSVVMTMDRHLELEAAE